MIKNSIIILFLCIALAFVLRAYKLSELPLYGDELTMVYDSYSILKTGKDQLGNPWPLTFEMGAGRPAGYVYGSIPFVLLFGPTAWGVRGLSVISGLGMVVLMYFLGKKLYGKKVGLIASFLTAISPWDLSLSRGGFEAHFALFLSLLGLVFLLYVYKKPWFYIPSFVSFALTLFTYPTYKVLIPLFLLLYFCRFVNIKKILTGENKKYFLAGFTIFVTFLFLSYYQTFFNQSEKRFFNLNVFADQNLKQQIIQEVNYERNISGLPMAINKYFHNRPIKYAQLMFHNYLDNYSFNFLFLSGDGNPRHNMTALGYFYWVEIVFMFSGIIYLFKYSKKTTYLLIGWILISPLATALMGTPHGLRNTFMLPSLLLLSALGLSQFAGRVKRNQIVMFSGVLLFVIWGVQTLMVLNNLYFLSPNKYSSFWSYPAKQAVEILNNRGNNYDYVFLSSRVDNLEYAYQVYNQLTPRDVIDQSSFPVDIQGLKFKKFDNIYIGTIPTENYVEFFSGLKEKHVLYLANYDEREGLTDYEVYNTPDLLTGFIIKTF